MKHLGEIYSLSAAILWTFTSISFEISGKRYGSLTVNFIRLFLGFFLLSAYSFFHRGLFLPIDATPHNLFWLTLSGLVGFVVGDFLLLKAFIMIGARVSQVIMVLAPPIAAFFGFLVLREQLPNIAILGMLLTILGILLVILKKEKNNEQNALKLKFPMIGLLYALGGALGQGIGIVLSKYGMQQYDAFAASQIRVGAGALSFGLIILFSNKWHLLKDTINTSKATLALLIGTLLGPFLGVALSLLAIQNTFTGIAQTIMSIVPVLIIPFSVIFFKEKITFNDVLGAILAFVGVSLFFIDF